MRFERIFVWAGGAVFVGSLVVLSIWLVLLERPHPFGGWAPVAVDTALFVVFAAHHSLLARVGFQDAMRKICPDRLLRSVYVWTASVLLVLVCWFWQPIGGQLYQVTGWTSLLHTALAVAGLLLIVLSVRAIDALDLAGIRKSHAVSNLQITGPYRVVRHPLYLGWMLVVFAPASMTGDRLLFALISSAYLIIAIPWEERSLEAVYGAAYDGYRRRVRSRVIPYVY